MLILSSGYGKRYNRDDYVGITIILYIIDSRENCSVTVLSMYSNNLTTICYIIRSKFVLTRSYPNQY